MQDNAFAKWLVQRGLLDQKSARKALKSQSVVSTRLDTVLLDLQLIPETLLLDALGKYHKTRTVSGAQLGATSTAVARLVTPRIASRLRVVPFRLDGKTLSVATLDPGDLLVEDEISLLSGCMVASFVTLEVRLFEALHRLYREPLSTQFISIIKRPAHQMPKLQSDSKDLSPEPIPAPPTPRKLTTKPSPAEGRRPPREAVSDELLEVSTEDLELFPSLRGRVAEPSQEEAPQIPAPETEAPTLLPEIADAELSLEERLAAASVALQNAEMREDIADAVLAFCTPVFRRRLLLVKRKDRIMGWRGEGEDVEHDEVRAIDIPLSEPSVFNGLTQGAEFWLGPLPTMPRNIEISRGLGGPSPKECFILPVTLREKTVCFIYGDNLEDGVGGIPMAELRRLGAKASMAFQVYIMKSKIRTL